MFLALIAALGTMLLKIISLGKVICFSFDLNYYDFSLNNTDFIMFTVFLIIGGITLFYCYRSKRLFNKIHKETCKLNKPLEKISNIMFGLLWAAFLPLLEFILFVLFISTSSVAQNLTNELLCCIIFSILMLGLCILFLQTFEENSTKYILIIAIIVFILSFAMIEYNFNTAKDQKCFDIITYDENSDGESELYAVISSGDYFSAYICEFSESEENKVLTIYSEKHKFFAIDSVTTEKMYFADYNVFPDVE